ncbi:MAG: type VI secretion system baseplate subunit TssG [Rhodobacteraceae bacterium]|nr:type VI secretion system baseplate subunit TssG [Paracoccaceae bacterium]
MASNKRNKAGHLSRFDALLDHPEKFHVFQALRLIEAAYPDNPRLGKSRRPSQDPIRLKQQVDLAFATSTVTKFSAADENTGKPGEFSQLFFGLFGPNGPLPLHITEYAYNRLKSHRDGTYAAFADMFHHRMLSLMYRAYASGEPTSSFDRRGEVDLFGQKVAALAGLHGDAMANRDEMPDLAKLRYAGRLAHGTRNEEGLLALISGFFGAEVSLESFVGTWLELDPKDTWELGDPNKKAMLGRSCSIGSKVWTRQAKFTFRVGPVSLKEYKRLLPGGKSLERLKALVRNYMGDAMMWDVNLVLKAGEAEKTTLSKAQGLGWTTWLGEPPKEKDLDDLHICV